MNDITRTQSIRKRTVRLARYFLPVILLLILTSVNLPSFEFRTSKQQTITGQDDTAAIEEQYGIRVKRIAVLAGGGVVEFRFLIVDPEKANKYMHDSDYLPTLITEDNGARIEAPQRTHRNMVYKFGVGYHILYRNPGGAVKSGTPVTLVFNDLQQHIIAQ